MPFLAWSSALIFAAAAATEVVSADQQEWVRSRSPAATAGSSEAERLSLEAGLRESLPRGLLLRLEPVCRDEGERERLSNLDVLRGSGSVWSKRERFTLLSSSAILLSSRRRSQGDGTSDI